MIVTNGLAVAYNRVRRTQQGDAVKTWPIEWHDNFAPPAQGENPAGGRCALFREAHLRFHRQIRNLSELRIHRQSEELATPGADIPGRVHLSE